MLGDPGPDNDPSVAEYLEDGILLVENGLVVRLGPAREMMDSLPKGTHVVDHSGQLILPGLIDAHIHYPQTDMIVSYGEQLLEWLNKYTFPTEGRFENPEYARDVAHFFLDELLRNGTTTALVLATVHPGSVDAIFNDPEPAGYGCWPGR